MQAAGVPPCHPLGGGELDLADVPPVAAVDELGLVEGVDALGEGASSASAEAATRQPTMRRLNASTTKAV